MFGWYWRRRFERDELYRACVVYHWVLRAQQYLSSKGRVWESANGGWRSKLTLIDCAEYARPRWLRCSLIDVFPEFSSDYLYSILGKRPSDFKTKLDIWFPLGDLDIRLSAWDHLVGVAKCRYETLWKRRDGRVPSIWLWLSKRARFEHSEVYRAEVILQWLLDVKSYYFKHFRCADLRSGKPFSLSVDCCIKYTKPTWVPCSLESVFPEISPGSYLKHLAADLMGTSCSNLFANYARGDFGFNTHVNLKMLDRLIALAKERVELAKRGY